MNEALKQLGFDIDAVRDAMHDCEAGKAHVVHGPHGLQLRLQYDVDELADFDGGHVMVLRPGATPPPGAFFCGRGPDGVVYVVPSEPPANEAEAERLRRRVMTWGELWTYLCLSAEVRLGDIVLGHEAVCGVSNEDVDYVIETWVEVAEAAAAEALEALSEGKIQQRYEQAVAAAEAEAKALQELREALGK